jgi:hypothetical protein
LTVVVNPTVPNAIRPAVASPLGIGCGGCRSALYEFFYQPVSFDLANTSMTLAFNGTDYTATGGTAPLIPPTGTALALGHSSEVTVPLPFSLPFPGGTTAQLRVCSNGFISPGASNGTSPIPTSAAFLGGAPRWAAAWHNLNPATGGQVIVDSSPTSVRVTWLGVADFTPGGSNTFQCEFLPSGTVNIVWQNMTVFGSSTLVGWSPGAVSPDPGPLDLSAALVTPIPLCLANVMPITLLASARPVLGSTINLQTTSIPPASAFAAVVLSFTRAMPPIDLTTIGMPGCFQYPVGGSTLLYPAPGAAASTPLIIPVAISYAGLEVIGQSFSYSPLLTPLGVVSSNGLLLFLGTP